MASSNESLDEMYNSDLSSMTLNTSACQSDEEDSIRFSEQSDKENSLHSDSSYKTTYSASKKVKSKSKKKSSMPKSAKKKWQASNKKKFTASYAGPPITVSQMSDQDPASVPKD